MQIYNESKTDTDYSSHPPFLLTNTNRFSESYEFHIFSTFNRLCYTVKKKLKKNKIRIPRLWRARRPSGRLLHNQTCERDVELLWRLTQLLTFMRKAREDWVSDIYAQSLWGLGVRHLCAKLVRIGCQNSYYRRGVITSENRDPSQDEAAGLDLREFVDFCRLC